MRLNNSEVEIASQNIKNSEDLKVLYIAEDNSFKVIIYIVLSAILACGVALYVLF